MSSRNEAANDETRGSESSDEETPINPEVRILSRIFGVHRASVASMPGTSAPAQPARRTPRQARDRLFWTLLGHSGRLSQNRCRGAARPAARAPPAAYKPSTSYTRFDSSLHHLLRRRIQYPLHANSSGNVVPDEPDAPRPPRSPELPEEPAEVSAGARPGDAAPAAPRSPLLEPADVSGEGNQHARGTKRKRDREVPDDTHESVSALNQSMLRLLECPVCMEWMEPPIAQCRRGHLACGACRGRLEACPVCRAAFSSVRNRAMEDVAGILRYPCRHGCGRELRAPRRRRHEASCAARRHACPLPACRAAPPLPRAKLAHHCQTKHPSAFRTGARQAVALGAAARAQLVVSALGALFHVSARADLRAAGVLAHVALLGPLDQAPRYTYEVTVEGRSSARRLVYRRATHSDLESAELLTARQDCFQLSSEQALNYLRSKNEHPDMDVTLDLTITLAEAAPGEHVADSS